MRTAPMCRTQDFALSTYGVTVGVANRVEFSLARQTFDTRDAGAQLGLGPDFKFNQNIFGAKVRLFGDAVLDQDTWVPQVAAGIQFKHNEQGDVVKAVGAASNSGTDFYLSATKLLLAAEPAAQRHAAIHQGEPVRPARIRRRQVERLSRRVRSIGGVHAVEKHRDRRRVPHQADNLSFAREQNAYDAFVAWAPTKHVSLTARLCRAGRHRDDQEPARRSTSPFRWGSDDRVLLSSTRRYGGSPSAGAVSATRTPTIRSIASSARSRVSSRSSTTSTTTCSPIRARKPYFEDAPIKRIKQKLVEQFCVLLGGPCEYTGRTMKRTPRGTEYRPCRVQCAGRGSAGRDGQERRAVSRAEQVAGEARTDVSRRAGSRIDETRLKYFSHTPL